MSSIATHHHKGMRTVERAAALFALRHASARHPHAGIRPHKENRGEDRRSEGLRVPPTIPPSKGFDDTMHQAGEAWPDSNRWDVMGAGDMDPVDGSFLTPDVYGSFDTFDEADGFAAGGGDLPAEAGPAGHD